MNEESLKEALFEGLIAQAEKTADRSKDYVGGTIEDHADALRAALDLKNKPRDFEAGDIIRRKRGLEAETNGFRGEIAVAVRFLDKPVTVAESCPHEAFGYVQASLVYDLVLGHMGEDGAMLTHVVDSSFYEKADV